MANIIESRVTLEDEVFEETIDTMEEPIEVVRPSSYNDLEDLPQINGVTLTGNKTSSDLGIVTSTDVENAVSAEATLRENADTALGGRIDDEITNRGNADTALGGRIDGEITNRTNADNALGTRIDNEILARQGGDNNLQTQIDAITSKSDVVDVVANYAALQAYDTSSLGNNDVIKVLDDETHEDALTYYRWSTTTQTWSYIGQEAPYYSKGQMDVMLQGKQDTLTAGANIQIENDTISATDTTYTAGNGLNLNGTEFSADTDILAAKEDLEDYYTKTETDNLLAPKLEAEVVAELPTTGEEGKLYLTPKAHTTQTATGNPITATITDGAGKMESLKLDGDTYQQTYTGKNLLNAPDAKVVGGEMTCTTVESNHFSCSGTVSESWGFNIVATRTTISTIPAGSYVLSLSKALAFPVSFQLRATSSGSSLIDTKTISAGSTSETFTLSEPASVFTFWSTASQNTQINDSFTVQIETGSTPSSYEPYVGGVPAPNPSYPQQVQTVTGEQTVEIVGKNLFDKDNMDIRNGYLYSTTFSYRTTNADRTFIVPCEPNTTYTISRSAITSSFRAAYIDLEPSEIPADASSETSLTCAGYIANNSGTSITITTSATAKSLLVHYGNTNTDGVTLIGQSVATIMVEKSASATTYAPYSKQTLPINLGSIELCKLGDYQDYIYKDGNDWKVHKATATLTLNGKSSENWYIDQYAYMLNGVMSAKPFSDIANMEAYCKSFSKSATGQVSSYVVSFWYNAPGTGVRFIKDQTPDISSFINWLASNNQTVYYPLATATDSTITDQTLIAQLEAIRTASLQNGANTITNTATGTNLAGDMELGYYEYDPTNRYDKWLWLNLNNNYEKLGS